MSWIINNIINNSRKEIEKSIQIENENAKVKEGEIEVYRISKFETDKMYAFALYTRDYKSPDYKLNKYFTTNPLQHLGYYVSSERWGYGDGGGGAENFINLDGQETRIELDYHGKSCFTVVNI